MNVNEQIIEKVKKFLPEVHGGENSGLPYAVFQEKPTLIDNLRMIERILFVLNDFSVQSYPILLDLKNGCIELRYATNAEQQSILESAR